jgi:hypothetical protein
VKERKLVLSDTLRKSKRLCWFLVRNLKMVTVGGVHECADIARGRECVPSMGRDFGVR